MGQLPLHLSAQRTFCANNFPLVLPRAWSREPTSLLACTIISSKLATSAINPGGFVGGLRKDEWQNKVIRAGFGWNKSVSTLAWCGPVTAPEDFDRIEFASCLLVKFKRVKNAAHTHFFHSLLSLPMSTRDENLSFLHFWCCPGGRECWVFKKMHQLHQGTALSDRPRWKGGLWL